MPSDGCETWNSNRTRPSTPVKHTCRNIKTIPTPSGSRIWRHDGQPVSTPPVRMAPITATLLPSLQAQYQMEQVVSAGVTDSKAKSDIDLPRHLLSFTTKLQITENLPPASSPRRRRIPTGQRQFGEKFVDGFFFFFLKFGFSIPPHRERDERKGANHSRPEIAGRQFCHRRCDGNWKPSHPRISGGSCSSGRPSVLAASHAVATGAPAPPKPSSKIGSAGPLGLRNFPRPRLYGRRVDARRPAALPPSYGRKSLRLATPIVARAVATSQELRSFGSRRKPRRNV